MRKKVKRNIACLLLFAQIFFSAFAPLSFLIQSASAQQNQEQQSPQAVLSFAHEADSALSVHNHSADELEYRLYYLHQGLVQKITGELTASQQNVLFLGTQSGEHFTGHSWDRMVFQVSDPNGWSRKYWLVRTDNQITTERFTNIDQLGLSTNDRQWLTWQIDEAAMRAVTFQNVVAFQTYTFPLNDKVQITFTQLPEESSPLAIGQIELSDELAERYGTDVAFDITTDMENGEFEFDLSLPKPEGVEGDEVEVIYADSEEDLADESKVSKVETERDGDEDEGVVRVKGVEHLTVFVVVPEDILSNNSLQYYFQQGWRMTSFGNASIELVDVGAIQMCLI